MNEKRKKACAYATLIPDDVHAGPRIVRANHAMLLHGVSSSLFLNKCRIGN